jgi:hypothetical protein
LCSRTQARLLSMRVDRSSAEVSREHYGKIQGVGHYRTYLGLLGAGTRQVDLEVFENVLDIS